jgi:plastocyanin
MRAQVPATVVAAVLLFPCAAVADTTIQAVDGPADNPNANVWAPAEVTVTAGEQVTWSFAGTALLHNLKSDSSNWSLATPFAAAGPAATQTFAAPGTYLFVCELHRSSMTGKVVVLDAAGQPAPPPPPPPLSEQPFTNDIAPLSVLETRDTVVPILDRVRAARVERGVRVRFRLSEAGRVTVKLTRGARIVKTRRVDVGKGAGAATFRGLKPGAYRVQVSARDLAGLAAPSVASTRVSVREPA